MDNLRNLLDTNSRKRVGPPVLLLLHLCTCMKPACCMTVVGCAPSSETARGQRCLKNPFCSNLFQQMTTCCNVADVLQPNYNLHCVSSNKRKHIDSFSMKRALLNSLHNYNQLISVKVQAVHLTIPNGC